MRPFIAVLALLSLLPAGVVHAQQRIAVVRDNSIVLYPGEEHLNAGRLSRIRIKGNQHLVAMAFDRDALRGRMVRSAVLVCRKVDHHIGQVTLSTIQADWDESRSNAQTSGSQGRRGWGRPGAWFPEVTGGNAFSLVCHAKSTIKDGCYHWPVDPDLIHACAVGAAYGITIHEASSDYSRNPRIWAREARKNAPYLLVTLGGEPRAPQPPVISKIERGGAPEEARLVLEAPDSGFAYEVTLDGKPLPRWNIPFVRPGSTQVIPIRDAGLSSGRSLKVQVSTLNRTGARSRPAFARMTVPRRRDLPHPVVRPIRGQSGSTAGLVAIPQEDRYDAAGQPVGALPSDYRQRNGVFDGRTVALKAARGEVVGFQALVRGTGSVSFQCRLPGVRTDMYRAVYVTTQNGRKVPDPLVPATSANLSPDRDVAIVVDLFVPFEFAGREHSGWFTVSDGRKLPVHLTIRDFAIPKKASFLCEMNSYGLPNTVDEFYRLQETAYDHRVHCNILHYSHRTAAPGARKCNMDMVMASGRRMDEKRYNAIGPGAKAGFWDDFVEAFGPYLSGKHFAGGHRGAIPAPGFYLTFHESWPLNVRSFHNGNPDAYQSFREKPEYAQTFVDILKDFIRVAAREGWPDTGFQIYLNNKSERGDRSRSPWTLDEPAAFWDYRALAFYADLVRRAKGDRCPVQIRYRIDISRPQFDRGELFGKSDLWVVGTGGFRRYGRIVRDRAEFSGEKIWVYGSSSAPDSSSREILAWVLEAYCGGASGIVPWQTINRTGSAMQKADKLGLFIFDRKGGGIRHSMRLKAYRRVEQDIEYLELLRKKFGLSDEQMRGFVSRHVDVHPPASGTRGQRRSPENFRQLRESTAILIAAPR